MANIIAKTGTRLKERFKTGVVEVRDKKEMEKG